MYELELKQQQLMLVLFGVLGPPAHASTEIVTSLRFRSTAGFWEPLAVEPEASLARVTFMNPEAGALPHFRGLKESASWRTTDTIGIRTKPKPKRDQVVPRSTSSRLIAWGYLQSRSVSDSWQRFSMQSRAFGSSADELQLPWMPPSAAAVLWRAMLPTCHSQTRHQAQQPTSQPTQDVPEDLCIRRRFPGGHPASGQRGAGDHEGHELQRAHVERAGPVPVRLLGPTQEPLPAAPGALRARLHRYAGDRAAADRLLPADTRLHGFRRVRR